MIVLKISYLTSATYVLMVSLGVIVLIIAYRKMLKYFGKGTPPKEDYCVLYGLENEVSKGEVEFYFTSEKERDIKLEILDKDFNLVHTVVEKRCMKDGNIIRFDSSKIPNGHYFYCLKTENQKTMKKFKVQNDLA